MIFQVSADAFINTDNVNYIVAFTDIGDGKEKLRVGFKDKDAICIPVTMEDFIKTLKERRYIYDS